jgi:hypothetical protein
MFLLYMDEFTSFRCLGTPFLLLLFFVNCFLLINIRECKPCKMLTHSLSLSLSHPMRSQHVGVSVLPRALQDGHRTCALKLPFLHHFFWSGSHHTGLTYIQQILRFVRVYELLFAQQMPVTWPTPAHMLGPSALTLLRAPPLQELFDEFTQKNISPEHYLLDWYAPPSGMCLG